MLDQIKHFREQFKEDGAGYKSNNAYIACLYNVGKKPDSHLTYRLLGAGPCHGSFARNTLTYSVPAGKVEYLFSQVQKLQCDLPFATSYIDWLVNESPWKEVFITKDPKDILEYGFVTQTDLSNNLVIGALIASRFITENYNHDVCKRIPVFKELVNAGCNWSEAYILCHLFGSEGSKKAFPMLIQPLSSGHTPFDVAEKGEDYYKSFLSSKPKKLYATFKENGGYSDPVYRTWGDGDSGTFKRWCQRLKARDAEVAVNYNIFEKKPMNNYVITNSKQLTDIVAQIKERLYE